MSVDQLDRYGLLTVIISVNCGNIEHACQLRASSVISYTNVSTENNSSEIQVECLKGHGQNSVQRNRFSQAHACVLFTSNES
jgi:hypothetical protein